jgi:GrpB-like predicted nucleotidyltransferase (UPF0157 family)
LLQTPKNYLYSFTLPKDKKVELSSYNPQAKKIADEILSIVKTINPLLVAHFIGSASLGIPGQNDIDIFVESTPSLFETYIPMFTSYFTAPKKIRPEFVLWDIKKNNYEVEIVLIDPKSNKYIEQMKGYLAIKNDPKLRAEYIELKQSLANSSVQEYAQKKMEFFNKAIGL